MGARNLAAASAGLGYGLLLFVCAAAAAGFGHGTYVLFGLYGSPLTVASLLGFGPAAFALPLYWSVVGWTLSSQRPRPTFAFWLLIAHYVGAALVFSGLLGNDFADWRYMATGWSVIAPAVFLGSVIYVPGQVLMWVRLSRLKGVR